MLGEHFLVNFRVIHLPYSASLDRKAESRDLVGELKGHNSEWQTAVMMVIAIRLPVVGERFSVPIPAFGLQVRGVFTGGGMFRRSCGETNYYIEFAGGEIYEAIQLLLRHEIQGRRR